MKSATSFFNPTIAKKSIKRTAPLWIGHLIIWIFAMPVLMNSLFPAYEGSVPSTAGYYILMTMYIGGILMAFFFTMAMTEILSNYLYASRSIGFYHSLPVKRTTIMTTNIVVVLATLLIPAAIVGLMTYFVLSVNGVAGTFGYIVQWFWMYVRLVIFFAGFSTLCANVTGHTAAGTIIYIILNFASVILEAIVRNIMSLFMYGISFSGGYILKKLSPISYWYSTLRVQGSFKHIDYAAVFTGDGYLTALLIIGLVMFGAAYLLYKRRHSEAAGEIISEPILRPAFKYCVTLAAAIALGIIFYVMTYQIRYQVLPNVWVFVLCMIIGGAIGYFISEAMLKKTLRISKKSWRGFAAASLVFILFGCAMQFDLFGIEGYVPSANDVESLTIYSSDYSYDAIIYPTDNLFDNAANMHQQIIHQKDTLRKYGYDIPIDGVTDQYTYTWITMTYKLTNGRTVIREYTVPYKSYQNETDPEIGYAPRLQQIFRNQEIIKRGYPLLWPENGSPRVNNAYFYNEQTYEDTNLKPEIYPALITAIQNDLLAGNLDNGKRIYTYEYEAVETFYTLEISFAVPPTIDAPYEYDYKHFALTVTPEAAETYAILSNSDNIVTYDTGDVYDPEFPETELTPSTVVSPV